MLYVNAVGISTHKNIDLLILQPLFFEAPVPPKEFQHLGSSQVTLTCG